MSEPAAAPAEVPASPQLYCGNCGAPIPPGKHFCEQCLAPASLAGPFPPPTEPAAPASVQGAEAAPAAGAPVPPLEVPPPATLPAAPPPAHAAAPGSPPAPAGPPPVPAARALWPGGYPAASPPATAAQSTRWLWIVLLVGALVLACPLYLGTAVVLLGSANLQEALVGLACAIPALVLTAAAVLGGVLAFRRPRS